MLSAVAQWFVGGVCAYIRTASASRFHAAELSGIAKFATRVSLEREEPVKSTFPKFRTSQRFCSPYHVCTMPGTSLFSLDLVWEVSSPFLGSGGFFPFIAY